MRALVYHGPDQKAWEEVPDPEILDDGDVIVRVSPDYRLEFHLDTDEGNAAGIGPGTVAHLTTAHLMSRSA